MRAVVPFRVRRESGKENNLRASGGPESGRSSSAGWLANASNGTPKPSRLWSFMPKPMKHQVGLLLEHLRLAAVASPALSYRHPSRRSSSQCWHADILSQWLAQRSQNINPGSEASPPAVMLSPKATMRTFSPARSFARVCGNRAAPRFGLRRRQLPLLAVRIIHIDEEPPIAKAGKLVVTKVLFAIEDIGSEVGDARVRPCVESDPRRPRSNPAPPRNESSAAARPDKCCALQWAWKATGQRQGSRAPLPPGQLIRRSGNQKPGARVMARATHQQNRREQNQPRPLTAFQWHMPHKCRDLGRNRNRFVPSAGLVPGSPLRLAGGGRAGDLVNKKPG